MIAPEPVFRIRGTPFSVRDRCRALSDLGHEVDLLTYPMGEDFHFPGVRIHRTRSIPGIHDVKIGFSWAKIPLDGLLFLKAVRALTRGGYQILHTHEEAGMIGAILGPMFHVPHIYDMHSSLPQQFENYKTSTARPVMGFMNWAERFILSRSQAIIAVCPHLKTIALQSCPSARVTVIENLAQHHSGDPTPESIQTVKQEFDLTGRFVVGYTGTFEVNQGLNILADAFAAALPDIPDGVLFLVGGIPSQIQEFRAYCRGLGIEDHCRLPGSLNAERMPEIMGACDVLASPRSIGTNTPLKLYSYLRSGVPILATDLYTHTQVLDHETAVLVPATPDGLKDGLIRLYSDPGLRRKIGQEAMRREAACYSYPAYIEKIRLLLETIL